MQKILMKIFLIIIILIFTLIIFLNIKISEPIIKIFNTSLLVVSSGSMLPELAIGDVIIIKECDDYNIGDIITYNVDNEYLVTHRIIEKEKDNFVTKGDNNNIKDNDEVSLKNIEGKVICNSKFFRFIYNYWIFITIAIFFVIIIL